MSDPFASLRRIKRWPWSRGVARPEDPAGYAGKSGSVEASTPCPYCEYDLLGARLGEPCPECGRPVGYAYDAELVSAAPADWLKRVRRGPRLMLLSIVLSMALGCVLGAAGTMTMYSAGGGAQLASRPFAPLPAQVAVQVACYALLFAGVWFFTAPRPGPAPAEPPISRRMARWMILPSVLGWIAWLPTLESTSALESMGAAARIAMIVGGGGVTALGWLAIARHAAHLLALAPCPSWARVMRILAWVSSAAALGSSFLALWVQEFAPPAPPYVMAMGAAPMPGAPASAPTTAQFLWVDADGSTKMVTTFPAGTSVFTPRIGTATMLAPLGCGVVCIGVPVLVLLIGGFWRLDRELSAALKTIHRRPEAVTFRIGD